MIYASRNKSVSFLKCFILKAIGLQGFLKMFWAHFFTICVSRNKGVCCEVQTYFKSF